jgi:cytochrome c oxidase cbb3-type subunit 3
MTVRMMGSAELRNEYLIAGKRHTILLRNVFFDRTTDEGPRNISVALETSCTNDSSQIPLRTMTGRRFISLLALFLLFLFPGMSAEALAQGDGADRGMQQFMANCSGCHGADGKGGDKAASIATTLSLMKLSDGELTRIVHDGTAQGMPSFAQIGDANITAVVRYLRTLEAGMLPTNDSSVVVTGDVDAGRALYFGKAQCSNCHMIAGEGGFIASDLTVYGNRRTTSAILKAIVTPDIPLAPTSRVVDVITRTGQKLTGVLRSEDNFNLVLQTRDGRYHFLSKSELKDLRYTDHSLMPHDYGTRLTPKELNDIVSFLIVTGRGVPSDGGPRRASGAEAPGNLP